MSRRRQDVYVRFWRFVDVLRGGKGCMIWGGAKDKDGYGLFQVGVRETRRAHRLAYMWYNNIEDIPPELSVMHICDTPACVNPDHLRVGTPADNTRDKMKKGRYRCLALENHPQARLTIDDVRCIRANPTKASELAKKFGVSSATISAVRNRRTWNV